MVIVITSCSASKDDTVPIPTGSRVIKPADYLDDESLLISLNNIRERIFQDSRANVGTNVTYSFDLYVRAGYAYRDLRRDNYHRAKSKILSSSLEWFFLSGGYGIVHALEAAKKYQATFSRGIAYQRKIPFTGNLWRDVLPSICDSVISKFSPECTYIFGSRDYTNFIKQTNSWRTKNVKMFESTGSPGPHWLSPRINELMEAILNDCMNMFNEKYGRYTKQ